MTVSCERIKQLVYHELNVNAAWHGKIYFGLVPSLGDAPPITIMSERFGGAWQYRVELPDLLERGRYVRTIVQVLLLEFANRTAGDHSAEIPVWLSEGLAQQLLASNEIEIILPPPRPLTNGVNMVSYNISGRRNDPLERACSKLRSNVPLSFYEISWPPDDQWSSHEAAEVYRSSAQLFLYQLTQLKEGRAGLRGMLANLPRRLNWQLAFLDAFHSYFQRTLDVEKWWALQIVHFTGRDTLAQTWDFEESRRKLDDALHVSVEIHTGTNELPLHTTVSLKTIIRDADNLQPAQGLRAKRLELDMLRPRIAQEFIPLVDKYWQVLDNYLKRQDKSGTKALERDAQEAVTQLEELDVLRASVRPRPKAVASHKP